MYFMNMLELLKAQFGDELMALLTQVTGENATLVRSGLDSIVPAVLSGVAHKGATPQGAEALIELINQHNLSAQTLPELSAALSKGELPSGLLSVGQQILSFIFGERVSGIADWIAQTSGMGKTSTNSLLSLFAPVVLGFLGNEVKTSNLTAGGLASLLAAQLPLIKNHLNASLGDLLGLTGGATTAAAASGAPLAAHTGPFSSPWKWLIPLLILGALLLFGLKNCFAPAPKIESTKTAKVQGAPPTDTAVHPKAGDARGLYGPIVELKLPDGVVLQVPELGIEKKLVTFIQDASKTPDEKTWFTFDGLEFETGSHTLKASSRERLKNVAAIMKAFPTLELKIGGYTDNVGDPQVNLKLSHDRAYMALQELVDMGVAGARLSAEGYGEQYPVADNSTEDGRTRNRRVDLRVIKK